jgi:hypothetical protein
MQDLIKAGRTTDRRGQIYREVRCYSIATVISAFDCVDLLHIDIQGQELEAVRGSIDEINAKVKLMFIGTHEFAIDAELIRCLAGNGWEAKHILPRNVLRNQEGRHMGTADGEQLWINPRLV